MWAFKTLWDKGLVYEGFRVLAYCWRCETPLSNTETRMDDVYRDRQDPALTVGFELLDGPLAGAELLAWTTTPGRCRPTSRSPSAPTSTTPSSSATAAGATCWPPSASPPTRASSARRRWSCATVRGADLVGAPVQAAVRLLHRRRAVRHRAGVPGPRPPTSCRPRTAPASSTSRRASARTTSSPATRPASRRSCPMDEHGRYTAEVARGSASTCSTPTRTSSATSRTPASCVRHETYDHPYPHCWRCAQPLVYRADLVVVRRGHGVPRPHGRAQRARSPGCPSTSSTAASASGCRTPATGRSAATASGARRSRCGAATTRATRGSTSTARSPSWRPTSACGSPTSTGRPSTSWCGRTPTTRRAAR